MLIDDARFYVHGTIARATPSAMNGDHVAGLILWLHIGSREVRCEGAYDWTRQRRLPPVDLDKLVGQPVSGILTVVEQICRPEVVETGEVFFAQSGLASLTGRVIAQADEPALTAEVSGNKWVLIDCGGFPVVVTRGAHAVPAAGMLVHIKQCLLFINDVTIGSP